MPVADSGSYQPPKDKGGKGGGKKSEESGTPFEDFFNAGPPPPAPGRAEPSGPLYDRQSTTKLSRMPGALPVEHPEVTLPFSFDGAPQGSGAGARAGRMIPPPARTDVVEGFTLSKREKQKKSYEMTWEDYEALSPRQKAGVDFNTLLIQARERDLKSQKKYAEPGSPEHLSYLEEVSKMFGPEGGSDIYAPETLAVLRDIDYKPVEGAKRGDDLDDFLGLKVVIKDKHLKDFDKYANSDNILDLVSGQQDKLNQVQSQLAESTAEMQAALTKGYDIIKNATKLGQLSRNQEVAYLGGKPRENIELGDVVSGQGYDTEFQTAFEALANRAYASRSSELLGAIAADFEPEGKMGDFLEYVKQRAELAEKYRMPVGSATAVDYLSPEEIREILGTMKGERRGTRKRG